MSEKEIDIEKIINDNKNKLTQEEVDLISKNLIHNKEWKHNLNHSPKEISNQKININDNLFQDLEIFISYNHDLNDTVYKKLNHTRTKLGDNYLKHLLSNPTNNIQILNNRQSQIKALINNPEKHKIIIELLDNLNQYQDNGLWICKEKSQEFTQIYEMLYFKNKFLQSFNTSEWFLKIYNYFQIIFIPLYGVLAPIIFFVLPYILIRLFFGIKIPISLYYNIIKQTFFGGAVTTLFGKSRFVSISQYVYKGLTAFLYFYGIYNSFKVAYTLNNIINLLHTKVNHLARFIKTSYKLYQECKPIFNLEPLTVSHLELWDTIFEKEPSLFSDKGKILKTFFLLLKDYDKLTPLLQTIGMIDSINSISYLYLINQNYYSYPEYVTSANTNKPIIDCKEIWNPFLDSNTAVKNDLQIGSYSNSINNKNETDNETKNETDNKNENENRNILITGPNASGKSTFIKSVVLGVLLSQTFSIVPSSKMIISPFQLINTYLNIPDAKGRESLFEAEMYRAKHHINAVKELKEQQFSFVVMDEIFNSTNYEEGVAGAYIVAKELGTISNSLAIITTHFGYLTKLADTNNFINYMFDIEKNEKQIIKSYKIKEGISKQYLALDLLENNGFNPDMIQEARGIFQELVERNNRLITNSPINELEKESEKEELEKEEELEIENI
jgi:DNA mismatch repair protein MutS